MTSIKLIAFIICTGMVKASEASIFATNEFETESLTQNSDGICRNNFEYIYPKEPSWGCQDIQFDETRRVELCQEGNVRSNCPIACGICCEDDPDYVFEKLNGNDAYCGWLSIEPERQVRYCDTVDQAGKMVRDRCPKTCGSCLHLISVPPSDRPSEVPTASPTNQPTTMPTSSPTNQPSKEPTASPSVIPTISSLPTLSSLPTERPSLEPSMIPSSSPSDQPSGSPSISKFPSSSPSMSELPTSLPSSKPSSTPSASPTTIPSDLPSNTPSTSPTAAPTSPPTASPSKAPSTSPTTTPTSSPTSNPASSPSTIPTATPSASPTNVRSDLPSNTPSASPTAAPTSSLTASPSKAPTTSPTTAPTSSPTSNPTSSPSRHPTFRPSGKPTAPPTMSPTSSPTKSPTSSPTKSPTSSPTVSPTLSPTSLPTSNPTETRPNLVMILTDEHNLRTLSCYRDYLLSKYVNFPSASVDVWGDMSLDTPNIDKLANEGAIFTNFYTVAPLCTPSRASFMTGLYPPFTGAADQNHGKLATNLTTWAEVLRKEKGYHTGYMGKWHLDGEEKPLWGSNNRDFGFEDNKYRYNRGHWKYFSETNGKVTAHEMDAEGNFVGNYKEHFATDFLMDRGIEFIESAVDNSDPFALVLSIPDPHGPNENRPYYRNMYDDIHFKVPETARKNWKFDPAPPGFNSFAEDEAPPIDDVDTWIDEFENGPFWQRHMQQYYGMVKCIDYNIGRLLQTLKDKGIDDNTIIVFTSDHGDTLMEHGKLNKGRPYETAAGIPFLVRYPEKVPPGKVIETAYSSVDFAPTILSLMGVNIPSNVPFQGVDGSEELTSSQLLTSNEHQIIYSFDTGNTPTWAAAIKDSYKFVVSKNDIPWLFDLNSDPEEMYNYIDSYYHRDIAEELRLALVQALTNYDIPLTEITNTIYLDKPVCQDSKDILPLTNGNIAFCKDLGETMNLSKCENQPKIRNHCPHTCGTCCKDSPGMIWVNGSARQCESLQNNCHMDKVQRFCPETCNLCK